jgi:hypothetical protein
MKHSLLLLAFMLAISAVIASIHQRPQPQTSRFSIAGVSLGMERKQVLEDLKSYQYEADGQFFWSAEHEVQVNFDDSDRVIGVSGTRLELDSVDCTPERPHDKLPSDLTNFLGEHDWKSGEDGDFVHEWGFDDHHLVLQAGCSGWYFFLGQLV